MPEQTPQIFNHQVWIAQRDRAAASFGAFEFLKKLAAERLAERLQIVRRDFIDILDFGCHTGQVSRALQEVLAPKAPYHLTISDHSAAFLNLAAQFVPANAKAVESALCEGEHLPVAPQSCDLVLSALYLHWMNDLPACLHKCGLPCGLTVWLVLIYWGGEVCTNCAPASVKQRVKYRAG